ncbi:MAG: hypothetical protein J2O49_08345 [Sciscionella sp.]|nr:hypothetical protein [Sciscionella sp.]
MTGERWLDAHLRPTVARVRTERQAGSASLASRGDTRDLYEYALAMFGQTLSGQVDALAATGVLTAEQQRQARAELRSVGLDPATRTLGGAWSSATTWSSGSASISSRAHESIPSPLTWLSTSEPAELFAVAAGPIRLGELAGRTVTLVAAQRWNTGFEVELYRSLGEHERELMHRDREVMDYWANQGPQRPGEEPEHDPYRTPLKDVTFALADDIGTEYGVTSGSGETAWDIERIRLRWQPGVPASASRLSLRGNDSTGTEVFAADLPLPDDEAQR